MTDYSVTGPITHAIFGFVMNNRIDVTVIGWDGNPLPNVVVYAFKERADSTIDSAHNYTASDGKTAFYVFEGTYYVMSGDAGRQNYAMAYVIDKRNILADASITLDLRTTYRLSYRPPAPNQVMGCIVSRLIYVQSTPDPFVTFSLGGSVYYPASSDIYCSSTDLNFTSYYQHYPRDYMVVNNPYILTSPELYSISYRRQGIAGSIEFSPSLSGLVKLTRQYRVATSPALDSIVQRAVEMPFVTTNVWWMYYLWGYSWHMTVPKTLVEWLVPDPGYPNVLYYRVSYYKWSDAPNTYAPYFSYAHSDYVEEYYSAGEFQWPAGVHPLAPNIWLNCYPTDGGSLCEFRVGTDLHTDVASAMNLYSDNGRLVVKRNGSLILDTGWFYDYASYSSYGLELPARFEIELYGQSNLPLSTDTYTKMTFEVPKGGYYGLGYVPLLFYFDSLDANKTFGLDANNTHVSGDVKGYLMTSWSLTGIPTVEYSTDDGATWGPVEVTPWASSVFNLTIRELSGVFVSLRATGTFSDGTQFTHTVIRGFYVKPAPPVSQPTVNIDDMLVDSGIIKINATILSPTRITGAQYAVDTTSSPTSVPTPLDGTYDSTDERIHIEVNALSYAGLHKIYVRCFDTDGYPGEWLILDFNVRDLVSRYNLVSPMLSPPPGYSAFDISRAIGSAVTVVAKWDQAAQQYVSYVPSFSGSELDFAVESGYGYFVYLTSAGKLIEVSWP